MLSKLSMHKKLEKNLKFLIFQIFTENQQKEDQNRLERSFCYVKSSSHLGPDHWTKCARLWGTNPERSPYFYSLGLPAPPWPGAELIPVLCDDSLLLGEEVRHEQDSNTLKLIPRAADWWCCHGPCMWHCGTCFPCQSHSLFRSTTSTLGLRCLEAEQVVSMLKAWIWFPALLKQTGCSSCLDFSMPKRSKSFI
jgi:hypothetical protein